MSTGQRVVCGTGVRLGESAGPVLVQHLSEGTVLPNLRDLAEAPALQWAQFRHPRKSDEALRKS